MLLFLRVEILRLTRERSDGGVVPVDAEEDGVGSGSGAADRCTVAAIPER